MELPPLPPPPLESREVSQGEERRSLCSGAPFVLAHPPPLQPSPPPPSTASVMSEMKPDSGFLLRQPDCQQTGHRAAGIRRHIRIDTWLQR